MNSRAWKADNYAPTILHAFYWFNQEINGQVYSLSPLTLPSTTEITATDNSDWIDPTNEITRILVESLRQVPQVVSVCAQFSADGIMIWTLLDAYDRDAREAVYKREMETCDRLGACDFDFRVSTVDLVSPKELVESGSREIYRRP